MPRSPASQVTIAQGLRLRQLREALDLSQQAVGDIMGCADNTISGYEAGRTRIDILNLHRFCEHTGVSADWIVLGRLGALPMDVAARIQAQQRAQISVAPRKRGRPTKPAPAPVPTVDEAPGWPQHPRGTSLHEAPGIYVPAPKIT